MRTFVVLLLLAVPAFAADPPLAPPTVRLRAAGLQPAVVALAWLPDGTGVVVGYADGSVRVWTVADQKEEAHLPAEPPKAREQTRVSALAVSPDGKRIAVARSESGLCLWDRDANTTTMVNAAELFPMALLTGRTTAWAVKDIAFVGDRLRVTDGENTIATLTADGKLVGQPTTMPREFGKGDKALIRDAATVSAAGGVGVAYYEGDDVDEMRAWDFAKNELRSAVKLPDRSRPHASAISPDGRLAVLAGAHEARPRVLRVHDVATWLEVAQLTFPRMLPTPLTGTFSPDGRLFAVRTEHRIRPFVVYDTVRWTPLAVVGEYQAGPPAFSPDGRRAITGDKDGRVVVHDLRAAIDPVPPKEFDAAACWNDLVAADGAVAMRAVYRFADHPAEAVKFFQEKVKPVQKPTAADLTAWVKALDAPAFADRQAATKKLTAVADAIEPELKQEAANNASPEVAQALTAILDGIAKSRRKLEGDHLRVYRVVQALEMIGPPAADALKAYAAGAKGAFLTQEADAARGRMR